MQVLLRFHKGHSKEMKPAWFSFVQEKLPLLYPPSHLLSALQAELQARPSEAQRRGCRRKQQELKTARQSQRRVVGQILGEKDFKTQNDEELETRGTAERHLPPAAASGEGRLQPY